MEHSISFDDRLMDFAPRRLWLANPSCAGEIALPASVAWRTAALGCSAPD